MSENNTQGNSNTNNAINTNSPSSDININSNTSNREQSNQGNQDNSNMEDKGRKYADRFLDVESLEKSYLELEKEHNRKANEIYQLKSKVKELEEPSKSVTELIKEKIDSNLPIDYEEFNQKGISKEVVDIVKNSIETSKALETQKREQELLKAYNYLGNQKEEVTEFANEFFNGDSFSEAEREQIKKLNEENPLLVAKLSKVLYESYTEATKSNMITNPFTKRMGSSQDVFKSEAELREAMRDDRFKSDKSYRQAVLQKMGRSKLR